MNDEVDALLTEKRFGASPGFAARLTALAQATAQAPEQSRASGVPYSPVPPISSRQ